MAISDDLPCRRPPRSHDQEIVRMQPFVKLVLSVAMVASSLESLCAQDLSPRAYVITPLHSNAITLTYSFYDGSIILAGTPITGATGAYHVAIFSYYHSLSVFGRSANITAVLPYALGNFQGTVQSAEGKIYRSGLLDSAFRFSVNLKGGPAMPVTKY